MTDANHSDFPEPLPPFLLAQARQQMLMRIFLVDPVIALSIAEESVRLYPSSLPWARVLGALEVRFIQMFAEERWQSEQEHNPSDSSEGSG